MRLRRSSVRLIALTVVLGVLGAATVARAQDNDSSAEKPQAAAAKLKVGDPAPAVKVEKFLKGEPVDEFQPGHIYVVEFWATWCGPCIASIPHLAELQNKFKDKATIISVNIREDKEYNDETPKKAAEFVKKNDAKMAYTVAYDGAAAKTDKAYMQAAGQSGIPCAFIVTPDAKIAFIGHPMDPDFEGTIQKLADGKFDMAQAIAADKEKQALEATRQARTEKYIAALMEAGALIEADKIDEALAKIDAAVKLMPEIAPQTAEGAKFALLMSGKKYDRAYAFAAKLVAGPAKDDAEALKMIAWTIVDPAADVGERDIGLATRAAERAAKLTEHKNAAILDTLARCHWIKGEKKKAIELQMAAVELAKGSMKESLQETLDEYRK